MLLQTDFSLAFIHILQTETQPPACHMTHNLIGSYTSSKHV